MAATRQGNEFHEDRKFRRSILVLVSALWVGGERVATYRRSTSVIAGEYVSVAWCAAPKLHSTPIVTEHSCVVKKV